MKKVLKFLCLLLIAALIAILVLKNGASAASVEDAYFSSDSVDVGGDIDLTVEFADVITSCSGTFTCSGGGELTDESGGHLLYYPGGATSTPTFSLKGKTSGNVTISFNFETVTYEDGTGDTNVTGSATIVVNGDEEEAPQITPHDDVYLQMNGESSGEITTQVEATWTSSNENVAGIQQNSGTSINIIPRQAGTCKITASNSAGSDTINVVVQGGEQETFSASPASITSKGETTVTISGGQAGNAESDNNDVATASVVGDGDTVSVNAKASGDATITITKKDSSETAIIRVHIEGEQTTFSVSPDKISSKGQTPVTVTNGPAESASSSNPDVATAVVTDDGNVLVDATGTGTATITITKKDSSDTATITVNIQGDQPPVEGQTPELDPTSITLNAGGESATISVKNNVPVNWTSSNSSVVAIAANSSDTQAAIISNNSGTAIITATAKEGGKTATVAVTVNRNEQAAPTITPSGNIKLEVGKSVFLSANQGVNWTSGNSAIATVSSDGTVTAKGVGETRITATNGSGKSSSVTITVTQAPSGGTAGSGGTNTEEPANPDQGTETTSTFSISPTKTQTLNIGDTLQIKVTKGTASSWKSSKPAVATVDNSGKVTANSAGTTIITAVASDGSVAQVKVRVRDENGEVPDPDSESNTDVPSTGEASTELLLVLGVLTCVIAMFIFRKKTK